MRQPDPVVVAVDRRFGEVREALRDARLFITGGTGFLGRWLLEYLAYIEDHYSLGLTATVLTRDRAAFAQRHHAVAHLLGHRAIGFIEGDVRGFDIPSGRYSHVIHGAHTSARATFDRESPLVQFDTASLGTRRVLDFAVQARVKRFLMLSSGSVYGPPPGDLLQIAEEFSGAPLTWDVGSALNHGKRAAEFQCAYYGQHYGLGAVIARCFSFVGPGLPLDIHYAIGNFIRDALWGDAIVIQGDGRPIRSYMDVSDWLVWSLTLLTKAPAGSVYNVGSDEPISILDLAIRVRDLLSPGKPIMVGNSAAPGGRPCYVPSIEKARRELKLDVWTTLGDAILQASRFALANTCGIKVFNGPIP